MAEPGSVGVCELCGARKAKGSMPAHLKTCVPKHDASRGPVAALLQLRVQGATNPVFWLDLEIKRESKLKDLDRFLRRVWLECCGHLSSFHVNEFTYSVVVDKTFGSVPNERSMNYGIGDVLSSGRQRFRYDYDFGSTTELEGRVWGMRDGSIGRSPVRVLARNEPPVWPCSECREPATLVCTYCLYDGDPFSCAQHAPEHECADDESFLPVVNSPRMGVCGYTGEA